MKARLTPWGCIDKDGRPRLGRDLDQPEPLTWNDAARKCTECKTPTHWTTERGRATHPCCSPRAIFDRLPADVEADMTYGLLAMLPVALLVEDFRPPGRRPRVAAYLGHPCEICTDATETLLYLLIRRYGQPRVAVRCKRHLFV
jgi:hypothetical protein